jgi:nucleoside recognition membrane protein YjiH
MKYILKIILLGVVISLLFIAPISEQPIMQNLHPVLRIVCNILLIIIGCITLISAGKEALHYMKNQETDY